MGYWLLVTICFAVNILCLLWLMRFSRADGRRDARNKAANALVRTLSSGIDCGALEEKIAASIFCTWDHLMNHPLTGVACACKSVRLHCAEDEIVVDDIKHSSKFCDVAS